MNPVSRPQLFARDVRRIHCVGIAGMGVGPLALYLVQAGFGVTGEDAAVTEEARQLLARGGVKVGPLPADAELVVHSSAVAPTHPACVAAAARGLPLVRRGELLAEVLRDRRVVAVCGAHGQTTTTAMLITALRRARFPAGWILGGRFADDTPSAGLGAGDWVVAEIDESDGTIGRFAPALTVVVNLDWDHPDHYRQPAELEAAFAALVARTHGPVLVSAGCAMSARAAGAVRPLRFGPTGDFPGVAEGETAGGLTLRLGGQFTIAAAAVRAQGAFNAANATAALAAAQLMGATLAPDLLADYPGVRRRQAVLQATADWTVLEDYAHHPAEIRALLASLRPRVAAGGRLVVVFQPHRFSRTAQFRAEFAAALAAADQVHLLEVYAAGEPPCAGGTTAELAAELRAHAADRPVGYRPGDDAATLRALDRTTRRGDLVAFVGAGDLDIRARAWLADRAAAARPWDEFYAAVRPGLAPATKFSREEPLGPKTTLRVGGAARLYVEPASVADLQAVLRAAAAGGVPVLLLGRGSNLLVPDEGVDGLVIALAHEAWAKFELHPDGRVWAGAGLRLKQLCGLAATAGLTGFEFLEGIPGNVGGALRMNAGAMGGWMFDVVEEVQLMTRDGEVQRRAKAALHVDYRQCAELHEGIALGAWLRPAALASSEAVARQIAAYRTQRQASQPREPSAGCMFKNPPGHSAGRLIDESGLKGARVGDAEVSTVHANFIVNRGAATGADVLELVRQVRARVRQAKGVELEPEVILYGQNWRDVL